MILFLLLLCLFVCFYVGAVKTHDVVYEMGSVRVLVM